MRAAACADVTGFRFCCLQHDRTTPTASGIRWVPGDHPARRTT
jgi:hypothetical protein